MSSKAAVVAVLVALLVSGCLAGSLPTAIDPEPEEEPLPETPTVLTEQTVSNYTTTYEEATVYNRHVDANPTENRITCLSGIRVANESAFVVRVQCMGGLPLADGSHMDIGASTYYYVSETTTTRIEEGDLRSERYRDYQPDADHTSFDVVNLANESVEVSVEFARNDSESPLQFDYEVAPHEGVAQTGLPFEYGTTREIRVRTDDATTIAQFTSERIRFDVPTVVLVLPDGQVRVTVGPSVLRMENP